MELVRAKVLKMIMAASAVLLAVASHVEGSATRAHFLEVRVTGSPGVAFYAVWKPYAGIVRSDPLEKQEQRILARRRWVSNPDSVRRWGDPAARDTIRLVTPAELVVDMGRGPFLLEAAGNGVIMVEAQRAVKQGQRVVEWGNRLLLELDGIRPYVTRRR